MSILIGYEPFVTTSNSFDFNLTRNQIIEAAYRKVGGLADGQTLTAEQISNASILLNAMVKNWRGEGIFLWDIDWINVPLHDSSIVTGTDSNKYECKRNNTSILDTKPTTGDKSETFWKQTDTGTASTWTINQSYLSIGHYFLDSNIVGIDQIRIMEGESARILSPLTKEEYFSLGNTTSEGKPTQYWFRRKQSPEILLYPYPDSSTKYYLEMCVSRFPDDFDTGTDQSDFLQEWLKPLIDGLAVEVATSNGVDVNYYQILKIEANESKARAKMLDHEMGDMFFQPDIPRELN